MSKKFVVAVYPDLQKINEMVKNLLDFGVEKKEIALITRLGEPEEELIEDIEIKKADTHVKKWAEFGAIAGGLLGLLIGGVVFTAPAVGAMVATGASLSGAINGLIGGSVVGGALFAISDGLAEWGVGSEDAKRLQKMVEEGKTLLLVRLDSETDESRVNEIADRMRQSAEKVEILA